MIVRTAVADVELLTWMSLTLMPAPALTIIEGPKFNPVKVTVTGDPRTPVDGLIDMRSGRAEVTPKLMELLTPVP